MLCAAAEWQWRPGTGSLQETRREYWASRQFATCAATPAQASFALTASFFSPSTQKKTLLTLSQDGSSDKDLNAIFKTNNFWNVLPVILQHPDQRHLCHIQIITQKYSNTLEASWQQAAALGCFHPVLSPVDPGSQIPAAHAGFTNIGQRWEGEKKLKKTFSKC